MRYLFLLFLIVGCSDSYKYDFGDSIEFKNKQFYHRCTNTGVVIQKQDPGFLLGKTYYLVVRDNPLNFLCGSKTQGTCKCEKYLWVKEKDIVGIRTDLGEIFKKTDR